MMIAYSKVLDLWRGKGHGENQRILAIAVYDVRVSQLLPRVKNSKCDLRVMPCHASS